MQNKQVKDIGNDKSKNILLVTDQKVGIGYAPHEIDLLAKEIKKLKK